MELSIFAYNYNLLNYDNSFISAGLGLYRSLHSDNSNQLVSNRRLISNMSNSESNVTVILNNLKPFHYYTTILLTGMVQCLITGIVHNLTINCQERLTFNMECSGLNGVIHNYTCPTITVIPQCVVWTHKSTIKKTNICFPINYTSDHTTCSCNSDNIFPNQQIDTVYIASKTIKLISDFIPIVSYVDSEL